MAQKVDQHHDDDGDEHVHRQFSQLGDEYIVLRGGGQRFEDALQRPRVAEGQQILRQLIEGVALAEDLGDAVEHVAGAKRGDKRRHAQKLHKRAIEQAHRRADEQRQGNGLPGGEAVALGHHAQEHRTEAQRITQGKVNAGGGEDQHQAHAGHQRHGGLLDHRKDVAHGEEVFHKHGGEHEEDQEHEDAAVILHKARPGALADDARFSSGLLLLHGAPPFYSFSAPGSAAANCAVLLSRRARVIIETATTAMMITPTSMFW